MTATPTGYGPEMAPRDIESLLSAALMKADIVVDDVRARRYGETVFVEILTPGPTPPELIPLAASQTRTAKRRGLTLAVTTAETARFLEDQVLEAVQDEFPGVVTGCTVEQQRNGLRATVTGAAPPEGFERWTAQLLSRFGYLRLLHVRFTRRR